MNPSYWRAFFTGLTVSNLVLAVAVPQPGMTGVAPAPVVTRTPAPVLGGAAGPGAGAVGTAPGPTGPGTIGITYPGAPVTGPVAGPIGTIPGAGGTVPIYTYPGGASGPSAPSSPVIGPPAPPSSGGVTPPTGGVSPPSGGVIPVPVPVPVPVAELCKTSELFHSRLQPFHPARGLLSQKLLIFRQWMGKGSINSQLKTLATTHPYLKHFNKTSDQGYFAPHDFTVEKSKTLATAEPLRDILLGSRDHERNNFHTAERTEVVKFFGRRGEVVTDSSTAMAHTATWHANIMAYREGGSPGVYGITYLKCVAGKWQPTRQTLDGFVTSDTGYRTLAIRTTTAAIDAGVFRGPTSSRYLENYVWVINGNTTVMEDGDSFYQERSHFENVAVDLALMNDMLKVYLGFDFVPPTKLDGSWRTQDERNPVSTHPEEIVGYNGTGSVSLRTVSPLLPQWPALSPESLVMLSTDKLAERLERHMIAQHRTDYRKQQRNYTIVSHTEENKLKGYLVGRKIAGVVQDHRIEEIYTRTPVGLFFEAAVLEDFKDHHLTPTLFRSAQAPSQFYFGYHENGTFVRWMRRIKNDMYLEMKARNSTAVYAGFELTKNHQGRYFHHSLRTPAIFVYQYPFSLSGDTCYLPAKMNPTIQQVDTALRASWTNYRIQAPRSLVGGLFVPEGICTY